MRPAAYLRVALAGSRVDALRLVLTAAGSVLATLTLLAAATVASIGAADGPYTSALLGEAGLRPGVTVTLVVTCVPLLVLLAQCSRIGAPAQHRHLSALRLAGATPRQVARLVSVAAGLGAVAGSFCGLVLYLVLRVALGGTGRRLSLPTDVLPAWWAVALTVLVVPVIVVAGTAWSLRRVVITSFDVRRAVRTRPPRLVPAIAVLVGIALFFVVAAVLASGADVPSAAVLAVLLAGFVLAAGGLLGGQGAIALWVGRALVRRTSRPALLLAGRRLIADPFAGTRATAVLSVAVLVAAGARHLRDMTLAETPHDAAGFYRSSYDLVDVAVALAAVLAALGLLIAAVEGMVARRRTYAAVVAAGMPRGVVARSVLAELLLPLIPSLLVAAVAGTAAATGLYGRDVVVPGEDGPGHVVTVGVAWGPLTLILVLALGVTMLTTSAGLLFLRRATDIGELRAAA